MLLMEYRQKSSAQCKWAPKPQLFDIKASTLYSRSVELLNFLPTSTCSLPWKCIFSNELLLLELCVSVSCSGTRTCSPLEMRSHQWYLPVSQLCVNILQKHEDFWILIHSPCLALESSLSLLQVEPNICTDASWSNHYWYQCVWPP